MQIPLNLDAWIKALSLLAADVAFGWGVIQFIANQRAHTESRRIEAIKPFLKRQLELYTEATLATSKKPEELDIASRKFWSLYWGELALVEDKRVETTIVQFGRAPKSGSVGKQLQQYSLALAHACRDSLANSWGACNGAIRTGSHHSDAY